MLGGDLKLNHQLQVFFLFFYDGVIVEFVVSGVKR
jgi:hypothetical protein